MMSCTKVKQGINREKSKSNIVNTKTFLLDESIKIIGLVT